MKSTAKRQKNQGVRKVCGCPRRTWAKCSHPWHFAFKWADTHYRFSLDKHLGEHVDSKTKADEIAADLRKAIKAGKFGQPAAREEMTLRQLADTYTDRYVKTERAATEQAFRYALNTICKTQLPRPTGGSAAFGDWLLTDIVTDTIERFREVRRGQTGVVGVNRNLQSLRAMFNWAIRAGYVKDSPFKRNGEAVVKIAKRVEPKRSRRLDPDRGEEAALLAACGPHLRSVVECAIEAGMRRGEILTLQWQQIQGMSISKPNAESDPTITWAPNATIFLPAVKTKTKADRWIPISKRLRVILEMRRFDPAGRPHESTKHVFGTEIGTEVKDIKRAWMTAVLKAHGHKPEFTETANLTAESRAAFDAIDLHFHDLRRECGSRWLEGGVPMHVVRDWLGHTSIAQTSTYLAGTVRTQHDAMRQFDERRATLQQFATGSKRGGRKRQRMAATRERNANKTAVGRDAAVM